MAKEIAMTAARAEPGPRHLRSPRHGADRQWRRFLWFGYLDRDLCSGIPGGRFRWFGRQPTIVGTAARRRFRHAARRTPPDLGPPCT